jgi:long-chain acyl-CoA synthetase
MSETLIRLIDSFADQGDACATMVGRGSGFDILSYAALAISVRRLAAGLLDAGLARQEPVALWASNSIEWIIAYLGIIAAGATAVPLDYHAAEDEINSMLARSGCSRLFTTCDRLNRLPPRMKGGNSNVYVLDALSDLPTDAMNWKNLLANHTREPPTIVPGDRAELLFTSGTTGTPKAVPLSHANLFANVQALVAAQLADRRDRVLLPLPLHHTYPLTVGVLGTLASGAALVLPAGLTGPQILNAIQATHASIIIGVPGLYTAMLNGIEKRIQRRGRWAARAYVWLLAVSTWIRRSLGLRIGRFLFHPLHVELGGALRALSSGGAKLGSDTAWKLEGLGWEVLTGYGLTETSPMLTFSPPRQSRVDCEGLPLPGVELRIEPVPGEKFGEITARGPSVFAGYIDDPAANAKAFTDLGWFRTGDLGFLDGDGYLHVVGRANETIVLPDGKKLFPDDLEAAYAGIPFIKEMAVLLYENELVALIVVDPAAIRERGTARAESLLREELESRAARLKSHERIAGYAVTEEPLPSTHLGKIKRHKLVAVYARAKAGERAPSATTLSDADREWLQTPAVSNVWSWLEARFPNRTITLDTSPQLDLGIDSLKWIELTVEIEDRFKIRLTEAAIARVITLRDLMLEITQVQGAAPKEELTPRMATAELERVFAEPSLGNRIFGLVLYVVNKVILHVLFGLTIQGLSNIPKAGGLVFVPNHESYLDPLALAAAFNWHDLRRTHWAGWTGILFAGPVMRAVSRAANVLPVDPDREPVAALALGAAVLQRERRLVWFPEGRRSPTGEINPFLPGIGFLLSQAGASAVPVRIEGTFEAWPLTRRMPRLRRLSIVFGQAVSAAELAQRGAGKDDHIRIANALFDIVSALPKK